MPTAPVDVLAVIATLTPGSAVPIAPVDACADMATTASSIATAVTPPDSPVADNAVIEVVADPPAITDPDAPTADDDGVSDTSASADSFGSPTYPVTPSARIVAVEDIIWDVVPTEPVAFCDVIVVVASAA